jgi:hypothetical protein
MGWGMRDTGFFREIPSAHAKGPVQPDDIDLPDPPSFYRPSFERDGTGRIIKSSLRVHTDEIYDLLDGLDRTRIRECSGCRERRLFWARRADQTACDKICANRIRVRKFYSKR